MSETRDRDIRVALREQLESRFSHDPDTRIIEELGLCQGSVRIDLAVANCALHGFEIKSAADTLQRLPAQAEAYSRTFDHLTLVSASRHLEPIFEMVPEWWGVTVATQRGGIVCLEVVREPLTNSTVDAYSIAQLLWREEALELLCALGNAKGVKSKPRDYLWRRLADVAPLGLLRECVRHQIKHRADWRVAAQPE